MEDQKIIALYFQKDESAIFETSQKYGNRLKKLSYGIVQNVETAEECEKIIASYQKGGAATGDYTRGLYYRGVE